MGYYVENTSGHSLRIPAENRAEVLRRWKRENLNPTTMKRGGSWGSDGPGQTAEWFSWMPEDWTNENEITLLEHMGFLDVESNVNEDGDIIFGSYDSKIGQEEHLLEVVGDLIEGVMIRRGEDGAIWAIKYELGRRPIRKNIINDPLEVFGEHERGEEVSSSSTKTYRITWRHEVFLEARSKEEAQDKWNDLNLGKLDDGKENGEIDSHDFVDFISID